MIGVDKIMPVKIKSIHRFNFSGVRNFCWEIKRIRIALYCYVFIFPLLLFVLLELLNPASSAGLFLGFPNVLTLLFSFVLITLIALAIYSLAGSVMLAYGITSFILLVGYLVNYFKLAISGGMFVPSDIFLAGAAFQVTDPGAVRISFSLVFSVLLILLIILPLSLVNLKMRFKYRIAILPIIILVVLLFLSGNFAVNRILPVFGLERGTVSERYRDQGMVLGFYSELVRGRRLRQINIEQSFFAGTSGLAQIPPDTVPNIIVIMSEAFMDPMTLDNITFSQYPIPNFRRLGNSAQGISGNVLVPVFGGGTINTEFEFLMGLPQVFYGSRFHIPPENIRRYFPRDFATSLPWLFRENGYRTVGVHTFYGTFFNRNIIYPLIGFDEFISSEQMPEAVYKGTFISDEYFTDRIIEQILLAENDDVPLFLFGISMQNHWDFDPMKYETLDLDVMSESPILSERHTHYMNSFMQGIFDADKQLGRIVDFIESRDTPTILVFFGDHLPILGVHADRIFEQLGFVTSQDDFNWILEDRANIFSTPYLVWANYDFGLEEWGNMSTYFLGAKVAHSSGITLNRYYTYLLQSRNYFRGLTNYVYICVDDVYHYGWKFRDNEYILALEALWYSIVFGEDYYRDRLAELME